MRRSPIWAVPLLLVACGGGASQKPAGNASNVTTQAEAARGGKILTFTVDNDNLMVDLVGSQDGATRPDGARDLVFAAELEGPFDAIFVYATDDRGNPTGLLRANTLTGGQESPPELGGVLETGKLSAGIHVAENGKFINKESGALPKLADEKHSLKLYIANTGVLQPGVHVRLYGRLVDGTLVKGPVIRY